MSARLVKRPEIVAWLNTTPAGASETWGLVGNGMTSGSYSYEASETSETYIVVYFLMLTSNLSFLYNVVLRAFLLYILHYQS